MTVTQIMVPALIPYLMRAPINEIHLVGQAKLIFACYASACIYGGEEGRDYLDRWPEIMGVHPCFIPDEDDPRYLGLIGGRVWYGIGNPN